MKKKPAPPKTGWLVWDASGFYTASVLFTTNKFAKKKRHFMKTESHSEGKWKISEVRITVIKK